MAGMSPRSLSSAGFRFEILFPGPAARCRVRVRKDGDNEPAAWDMDTSEGSGMIPAGGALMVAHNTDVTLGALLVTPNLPEEL